MKALASTIQANRDTLAQTCSHGMYAIPGYAKLPESNLIEVARRTLDVIITCLETDDDTPFIQFLQARLAERIPFGFGFDDLQQAVAVFEGALLPLISDIETAKFIWLALSRGRALISREAAQADRAQAEEAWRRNERLVQTVIDSIPQQIFWKSRDSIFLGCNKNFAESAGLTDPAQIIGKSDYDLHWSRQQADQFRAVDQQVMRDNAAQYHLVEPRAQADESVIWMETNKIPLHDPDGQVIGVLGTFEDVSERVRADEVRRQAEAQLALQSAALQAAANAIVITDLTGQIIWVNRAFTMLTGFAAEDALGQTPRLVKSGKYDQAFYRHLWETILAGNVWHGEMVNRRRDGAEYVEEQIITPVRNAQGEITHFIAVKQDISERKRAEQTLAEREELYRRAITAADAVPYLRQYGQTAYPFMDESIVKLTGYTAHEMTTTLMNSLIQETRLTGELEGLSHQEAIRQTQTGELNVWKSEMRILMRTGETRWLTDSAIQVRGEDGKLVSAVGILLDITKRKQVEQELARRAEQLATLNRVGLSIAAALDMDQVLTALYEQCRQVVPTDTFYVAFYDAPTGQIRFPLFMDHGQPVSMKPHDIHTQPGLSGHVIQSRQTLYIPDTLEPEAAAAFQIIRSGGEPARSFVGVPVILRDQVIGTLSAQSYQPKAYTPEQISLLETIGAQAAVALENARLYEIAQHELAERRRAEEALRQRATQQQDQARRLRATLEAADELIQISDFDQLCRRAVELARERLDIERCGLYLVEADGRHIVGTYGTDDYGNTTDERLTHPPMEDYEFILSLPRTELWAVHDGQHTYWDRNKQRTVGKGWSVGTVLRSATGPIGVLFNDTAISGKPVDGAQQDILGIYCSLLGSIIARKRLEQQIAASLARRDIQVRTSTEVAQEIAAAPALDELFHRVVTLVKERFGYYHTQIFRYDPAQDAVVLVTGYGEAGQELLAAGHKLAMGRGVVGTAAATGVSVLAADVTQDQDWRPNPNLPDTQGELAVPIKLRDQVLGILDVQSNRVNALTAEDQLLLEGLCGQIAVAIDNRQTLEALRRSEAELSEALRIAKLAYWEYNVEKDLFLFNDQFYALFHTTAEQEGGYQLPSARYAQRFVYPDDLPAVGGEIEKALKSTDRHYSRRLDHRILYAEGGMGYISVSINIDRDEQGRILRYYGANQDITESKLAQAKTQETLQELERLYRATTREGWQSYQAGGMLPSGYVFDRGTLQPNEDVWFPEIEQAIQKNELVQAGTPDSPTVSPLSVHGEAIGALGVLNDPRQRLSEEDITLIASVSEQVAQALESARLFEQTQSARQQAEVRLRDVQILQRFSNQVSGTLDLDRVLDALVSTLEEEMHFGYVAFVLIDEPANAMRTLRATGLAQGMNGLVQPLDKMQNDIDMDIARKGQIEIIDGWDDRFDRELFEREGHAALVRAFVPLRLREQTVGVLEVGYRRGERPAMTPEEVRLLGSLAAQVAVVIQNTRLFEQTQARARREQILREATARLRSSTDPDTVMRTLARELGTVLGRPAFVRLAHEGEAAPAPRANGNGREATASTEGGK